MNVRDIVDKFKDRYGYVKDINKVIDYLNSSCDFLSEINDILFFIYEWNKKVYESLHTTKKEMIFSIKKKKNIEDTQENSIIDTSSLNNRTNKLEVSQYMSQITSCNDLDFITDILPSIYDSNYENIILSIIMELYKEISFANEMLKNDIDTDEKEYLLEEINKYKKVINIIKSYNDEELEEEKDTSNDTIPNKIVYVTNSSGIPYILNDLNNINNYDYPYVLKAIKKLLEGNITHEKRFHNDEALTEISAIRQRDVRIIFTRGQNNTIILLGIFIKRLQNTSAYQDFIRRRVKSYKSKKDAIKQNILDDDYIYENERITENILEVLSPKNEKIKEIKGDYDGTIA